MNQPEHNIGLVRDYDDFYIATKTEAEEQIATAVELLELVTDYCKERF